MSDNRAWAVVVGLSVVAGLFAASCGKKPEPPPVAYMGPTLAADSLGLDRAPEDKTGYELLKQEPSTGLFPTAVGIARLTVSEGVAGAAGRKDWLVGEIGFEEAVSWNSLGNTIPAIREMIVLDRYSTASPTSDLSRIAGSAWRLEAGLCLVYGPSPAEDEYAGLWGVILDTASGERVALVRAQAGPEDFEAPSPTRLETDLRHRDVNYLAMRRFQSQVRQCLLAMIRRDQPAATTQPNPWQSKGNRQENIYLVPSPRPTPGW
ncbi:MAG TPA: hypothetical protein VLM89_04365 [Phycisphaerae bacterium]|nr:hypothetical protein [Phycisphaerae bacterium]